MAWSPLNVRPRRPSKSKVIITVAHYLTPSNCCVDPIAQRRRNPFDLCDSTVDPISQVLLDVRGRHGSVPDRGVGAVLALTAGDNHSGPCSRRRHRGCKLSVMDTDDVWRLVDRVRAEVENADDAEAVAAGMVDLLAEREPTQIVGFAQPLWDLLSVSYRNNLWAAAYVMNGGASDDGFDYFRGWLIAQGRETFERALTDPDSLATLSVVIDGAAGLGTISSARTSSVWPGMPTSG